MRLRLPRLLVVHPEMPLRVLAEAVCLDEGVFRCGPRLMLAPVVTLVEYDLAIPDQTLCVVVRRPVQLDRHDRSPFSPCCGDRPRIRLARRSRAAEAHLDSPRPCPMPTYACGPRGGYARENK